MKILITHFYTKENKGDAAILSVLINQINKVFTTPTITISTMENLNVNNNFEGYPLIKSFVSLILLNKYNKIIKLLNSLYNLIVAILWAFLYRFFHIKINFLLSKELKILLNTTTEADLIIQVGGGYLRGTTNFLDNINYFILIYQTLIGIILKKIIVLHSQSIGPFGTKFQQYITKFLLNEVNLIIVRENVSLQLLKILGVNKELIIKSVDAGFLFNSNIKSNLKDLCLKNNKKIVGITVAKKWLFDLKKQSDYEKEMAIFADKLIEDGYNLIFIPQVTSYLFDDDDRNIAKRIKKFMKKNYNVTIINNELSHNQIKTIYSSLDYIVGLRFHSIIFSLTSGIPAIAIEYEHKTRGIMHDLGLSEWVIKIESISARSLYNKFIDLVKRKEEYLYLLNKNLPPYIKEAEKTIYYIKNVYRECS